MLIYSGNADAIVSTEYSELCIDDLAKTYGLEITKERC